MRCTQAALTRLVSAPLDRKDTSFLTNGLSYEEFTAKTWVGPLSMQVFISYASEDTDIAQRLREDIGTYGADVFQFEHTTKAGDVAWDAVLEAIEHADLFIVLLSNASARSPAVSYEIKHAFHQYINEQRPRMIPLCLEPVTKPLELRVFQDVNLADYDRGFAKLQSLLIIGVSHRGQA